MIQNAIQTVHDKLCEVVNVWPTWASSDDVVFQVSSNTVVVVEVRVGTSHAELNVQVDELALCKKRRTICRLEAFLYLVLEQNDVSSCRIENPTVFFVAHTWLGSGLTLNFTTEKVIRYSS